MKYEGFTPDKTTDKETNKTADKETNKTSDKETNTTTDKETNKTSDKTNNTTNSTTNNKTNNTTNNTTNNKTNSITDNNNSTVYIFIKLLKYLIIEEVFTYIIIARKKYISPTNLGLLLMYFNNIFPTYNLIEQTISQLPLTQAINLLLSFLSKPLNHTRLTILASKHLIFIRIANRLLERIPKMHQMNSIRGEIIYKTNQMISIYEKSQNNSRNDFNSNIEDMEGYNRTIIGKISKGFDSMNDYMGSHMNEYTNPPMRNAGDVNNLIDKVRRLKEDENVYIEWKKEGCNRVELRHTKTVNKADKADKTTRISKADKIEKTQKRKRNNDLEKWLIKRRKRYDG